MIIPDINLLLYAAVDAFPQHDRSRNWWEDLLSGDDLVGIVAPVAFGFLRLSTSPRVLVTPMTLDASAALVQGWLARDNVHYLPADGRHLEVAVALLRSAATVGNLATDAQIAAHAVVDQGVVATNDVDFGRFPGVRTVNPLAAG